MKRKRVLMSVIIILVVLFIAMAGTRMVLEANLERLAETDLGDIDLSKLEDGVYTGSCKAFPIAVVVEVDIADHAIKEIRLIKHDNGQGAPAEVITDRIVEAQSLKVDVVAGATYSSKAILKSVEAALTGAER